MNNWKTNSIGICIIGATVLTDLANLLQGKPVDWQVSLTALLGGLGFFSSRDAKKTDLTPTEQVAAKQLVAPVTAPVETHE